MTTLEPRPLAIRGDVILLQALLKLTGILGNGGEVKTFLAENPISINGEMENRRGRKLRDGDVVELPGGERIRIVAERT